MASSIYKTILFVGSIIASTFLSSLYAQDTALVEIEEIIIMENRIRTPNSDKATAITIIDSETLSRYPISDLGDMLHYSAGIDIRTRGVDGIQNDISIRGSTFDQVLILVNGIKINDPQTGHHNLSLPVDLSAIDRIEIYKGSAARVFGQNAFAGAINIITRIPDKDVVSLEIRAGEFGQLGGRAGISFGGIDFRNYLTISSKKSDGYKYNTDYNLNSIFYQSEIYAGSGSIGLTGGYSGRNFGANGFYASPDYRDQYEEVHTSIAAISYSNDRLIEGFSLAARLYWRHNKDDYIFIRNDPSYYRNVHFNNVSGLDIHIVSKNNLGTSAFGLDIFTSNIISNRLGLNRRSGATLFLDHSFALLNNKLSIVPGLQANLLSDYESNLLPGIDIAYNISESLMIFGNSGFTFRVPTYTDLYYSDPVNESNPDLEPEYSYSHEVGIKTKRTRGISFSASLFYRHGVNMIDRVRLTEQDSWFPKNINKTIYKGFDLTAHFIPAYLFDNSISGIISNIDIAYCYIDTKTDEISEAYSRWQLENLKNQISVSTTLNYSGRISQTFNLRYYDRLTMDNYILIDTRIGYRINKLNLFMDITNIGNIEYRETNLVSMPGRWVKIGATYQFDYN